MRPAILHGITHLITHPMTWYHVTWRWWDLQSYSASDVWWDVSSHIETCRRDMTSHISSHIETCRRDMTSHISSHIETWPLITHRITHLMCSRARALFCMGVVSRGFPCIHTVVQLHAATQTGNRWVCLYAWVMSLTLWKDMMLVCVQIHTRRNTFFSVSRTFSASMCLA